MTSDSYEYLFFDFFLKNGVHYWDSILILAKGFFLYVHSEALRKIAVPFRRIYAKRYLGRGT